MSCGIGEYAELQVEAGGTIVEIGKIDQLLVEVVHGAVDVAVAVCVVSLQLAIGGLGAGEYPTIGLPVGVGIGSP